LLTNDTIDDFKKITLENARNGILEPGVARFDVLQRQDDPARFMLVEVYYSTEDQWKHRETAHFKKWRERVDEMLSEPYTFTKFDSVFPVDDGAFEK